MSITVRFSKNGFYHPAFGRMGLGKYSGDVYTLPDIFSEEGMLPKSAVIINDTKTENFEELLEEQGQRKPHKPKVVDIDQLEKAQARVTKAKAELEATEGGVVTPVAKPAANKKK